MSEVGATGSSSSSSSSSPTAEEAAATPPSFVKTRGWYGRRPGYVFKVGPEGLGYYLDGVAGLAAAKRHRDLAEEPGIPLRKRLRGDASALTPAQLKPPPAVKETDAFNPFADLPAPEKCVVVAAAPPEAAAAAPREKVDKVKVFAPGLFKVEKVHCLHIVRKHCDSRNPISWRNPNQKVTRTPEVATEDLRTLRGRFDKLPKSQRRRLFEDLARDTSDCGSARKGGDLGFFRRGKMNPVFENAAFNLEILEISRVTASTSGVHLIMRVG